VGQTYWFDIAATGASGNVSFNNMNFYAIELAGAPGPTGSTGSVDLAFMYQSGDVATTSFTGIPLYADVNFIGTFTQSYVVNVESLDPRDWTVTNKTTSGFRLNSNSTSPLTATVSWNAIEQSNNTLGAFVGAQGPTGPGIESVGPITVDKFWSGTLAQYNALGTYSTDTIYFIV